MSAIEATYCRPDCAGVCVADGFGVKVTVERGALQVHDGIGQHRRTRRYDRATHGLRRLVVVQPEGFVTFEALRWCRCLGVSVLVLDADGTPTLASTPRVTDDARLRRTQARQLEASAAAFYFAAWARLPETAPTFAAKDRPRVPAHWSTFETRRSVLASSPATARLSGP